jgi:hypothetical protein
VRDTNQAVGDTNQAVGDIPPPGITRSARARGDDGVDAPGGAQTKGRLPAVTPPLGVPAASQVFPAKVERFRVSDALPAEHVNAAGAASRIGVPLWLCVELVGPTGTDVKANLAAQVSGDRPNLECTRSAHAGYHVNILKDATLLPDTRAHRTGTTQSAVRSSNHANRGAADPSEAKLEGLISGSAEGTLRLR